MQVERKMVAEKCAKNKEVSSKQLSKKKLAIVVLLILSLGTVAFGQLGGVVYDPRVDETLHTLHILAEKSKSVQFLKTVDWLVTQYEMAKKHHDYIVLMDGGWRDPLLIAQVAKGRLAEKGVHINDLGWEAFGKFSKNPSTILTADSLNLLDKIVSGENTDADIKKTRDTVEHIYGDVPVTQNGAPAAYALSSVSKAAVINGQLEQAREEMMQNAEKFQKDLEKGGLTRGDIDRYEAQQNNMKLRVQLLELKAKQADMELNMSRTGMEAARITSEENGRLKTISTGLDYMKSLSSTNGETVVADDSNGGVE